MPVTNEIIEKYKKHLASRLTINFLKAKFPDVYERANSTFKIQMLGRIEYGKGGPRLNTILSALKNEGVLISYDKKDVNVYSYYKRKPDYRCFLEINSKWFNDYIETFNEKPYFYCKKTIKNGSCVATDGEDSYIYLRDLSSSQAFYVYKYLNDFDFIKVKERHNNRIFFYIKCFPRQQEQELEKVLFEARVEQFLKEHFEWVIKLLFDISENLINKTHSRKIIGPELFKFKDWSHKEITSRINDIKSDMEYYQKLLPVLEQIQKHIGFKNNEEILKEVKPLFLNYLKEYAPCHIKDNNRFLQQLSKHVLMNNCPTYNPEKTKRVYVA